MPLLLLFEERNNSGFFAPAIDAVAQNDNQLSFTGSSSNFQLLSSNFCLPAPDF